MMHKNSCCIRRPAPVDERKHQGIAKECGQHMQGAQMAWVAAVQFQAKLDSLRTAFVDCMWLAEEHQMKIGGRRSG